MTDWWSLLLSVFTFKRLIFFQKLLKTFFSVLFRLWFSFIKRSMDVVVSPTWHRWTDACTQIWIWRKKNVPTRNKLRWARTHFAYKHSYLSHLSNTSYVSHPTLWLNEFIFLTCLKSSFRLSLKLFIIVFLMDWCVISK
jgi:hypothetical protein